MEQGDIFPSGKDRRLVLSLDDFRNMFSKALRQNAIRDQKDILGDHNLNPGMSIPEVSKPAAVLIPVIGRDQEPTILLTRRSDDLNHHAGQVSFPGGRHEKSDSNKLSAFSSILIISSTLKSSINVKDNLLFLEPSKYLS